ncbi:kinase-like domain-containing protein, partial [Suillus clintonianus]|uniref:kinase-like domain-containing protein n=1 Tax=Suillus clintonianus TaxID=1904413 RepID=UPI001B863A36
NILIDKRGHARLIDFGLSTIIQPLLGQSHLAMSSRRPGAIRYAAPELVLPEDAHEPPVPLENADIWSFGCIMLQVLSGRLPWSEIRGEAFIIVRMSHGRGPQRPDGHDPAIIDLDWEFIQTCLHFTPELRPSAEEVLDFVIHRFSTPGNAAYFVVLCCSSTYTSFSFPGNPALFAALPTTHLHELQGSSESPDDPPDDAGDSFPQAAGSLSGDYGSSNTAKT